MLIPGSSPITGGESGPARDSAATTKAAADFEALLISQMLKGARESQDESEGNMSALSEMAEQQLAQLMSAGEGLGFRKLIVNGLKSSDQATVSKGE